MSTVYLLCKQGDGEGHLPLTVISGKRRKRKSIDKAQICLK